MSLLDAEQIKALIDARLSGMETRVQQLEEVVEQKNMVIQEKEKQLEEAKTVAQKLRAETTRLRQAVMDASANIFTGDEREILKGARERVPQLTSKDGGNFLVFREKLRDVLEIESRIPSKHFWKE
jgi:chromosome segregation ATPase